MRLILSISMNLFKKQVILSILLSFLCLSQSQAMEAEKDSLESFDISTLTKGDFHFRKVDFENLSEKDQEAYFSHTADFEAIQQMLGTVPACVFRPLLWLVPSLAYDMIVQERTKQANLSNNHTKFDWFIEQNSQFVGHISLTGLNTLVPKEIIAKIDKSNDSIFWCGGSLLKEYRGKRIARQLFPQALEQVDKEAEFKEKSILIATRSDNEQVHKLAQSNSFTFIGSAITSLDLGLYKQDMTIDYFIHHII